MVAVLHRQRRMTGGRIRQAQGKIFAEIPLRESLYAFFDGEAWAISRDFSKLIHASLGFINVPWLHGHQANDGGSAQTSLDGANQVEKLDRPLVSNVAKTHGRWRGASLRSVGFGRQGQEANHSLHHIVDEGEIALHMAEVIKLNHAPAHDRINKSKNRHIRPPPRTIDGEKSQSCGWDMKHVAIGVGQNLIALLRRRIEADRKIGGIFLGKRDPVVRPINRAGRSEDEMFGTHRPERPRVR